jgi:class 3 adenylate cyclase
MTADVAGYSRLMGADEEGTLERLKTLRSEIIDPKVAQHTAGSSRPLVMVSSSSSAVWWMRCAAQPMFRPPWPNGTVLNQLAAVSSSASDQSFAITAPPPRGHRVSSTFADQREPPI